MHTRPSQGIEKTNSGPDAAAIKCDSTVISPLFSSRILIGWVYTPRQRRTLREEYPKVSFLISLGQIIQGICIEPKQNTFRLSDYLDSEVMTTLERNSQLIRSVGDLSTTINVNCSPGSKIMFTCLTNPLEAGSSMNQLSTSVNWSSSQSWLFPASLGSYSKCFENPLFTFESWSTSK